MAKTTPEPDQGGTSREGEPSTPKSPRDKRAENRNAEREAILKKKKKKKGPLSGYGIVLAGTFFDNEKKITHDRLARKYITPLGGDIHEKVSQETFVVISDVESWEARKTRKIKNAVDLQIPVVSISWLIACNEGSRLVDPSIYRKDNVASGQSSGTADAAQGATDSPNQEAAQTTSIHNPSDTEGRPEAQHAPGPEAPTKSKSPPKVHPSTESTPETQHVPAPEASSKNKSPPKVRPSTESTPDPEAPAGNKSHPRVRPSTESTPEAQRASGSETSAKNKSPPKVHTSTNDIDSSREPSTAIPDTSREPSTETPDSSRESSPKTPPRHKPPPTMSFAEAPKPPSKEQDDVEIEGEITATKNATKKSFFNDTNSSKPDPPRKPPPHTPSSPVFGGRASKPSSPRKPSHKMPSASNPRKPRKTREEMSNKVDLLRNAHKFGAIIHVTEDGLFEIFGGIPTCAQCDEEYDEDTHTPIILAPCGHCLDATCVEAMIMDDGSQAGCPDCEITIEQMIAHCKNSQYNSQDFIDRMKKGKAREQGGKTQEDVEMEEGLDEDTDRAPPDESNSSAGSRYKTTAEGVDDEDTGSAWAHAEDEIHNDNSGNDPVIEDESDNDSATEEESESDFDVTEYEAERRRRASFAKKQQEKNEEKESRKRLKQFYQREEVPKNSETNDRYVTSEHRERKNNEETTYIFKQIVGYMQFTKYAWHMLVKAPSANPAYPDLWCYDLDALGVQGSSYKDAEQEIKVEKNAEALKDRVIDRLGLGRTQAADTFLVGVATVKQHLHERQDVKSGERAVDVPMNKPCTRLGFSGNHWPGIKWFNRTHVKNMFGEKPLDGLIFGFRQRAGQYKPQERPEGYKKPKPMRITTADEPDLRRSDRIRGLNLQKDASHVSGKTSKASGKGNGKKGTGGLGEGPSSKRGAGTTATGLGEAGDSTRRRTRASGLGEAPKGTAAAPSETAAGPSGTA